MQILAICSVNTIFVHEEHLDQCLKVLKSRLQNGVTSVLPDESIGTICILPCIGPRIVFLNILPSSTYAPQTQLLHEGGRKDERTWQFILGRVCSSKIVRGLEESILPGDEFVIIVLVPSLQPFSQHVGMMSGHFQVICCRIQLFSSLL